MTRDTSGNGIRRRRALQVIAAASTAGLAGCGATTDAPGDGEDTTDGGDGSGDGSSDGGTASQPGERVPTLSIGLHTDIPGQSENFTQWAEIYRENLAELGITAEFLPRQSSNLVTSLTQDRREMQVAQWLNSAGQFTGDPDIFLRLSSSTLGSDRYQGWVNWNQWVNCEFEESFLQQKRATTEEARREAIHEAISIMSNAKIALTQFPIITYGAWRSDQIEVGGTGIFGTGYPYVLPKSRHLGGDVIATNVGTTEINTTNPENLGGAQQLLGTLLYSPIVDIDENGELVNMLAESHEVLNDAKRHEFTLRPNLTFHDGEPITSEDVEFTFNLHVDNPQWAQSLFDANILDSFEVIDDRTFAINWTQPNLGSLRINHRFFEVLPEHIWETATDDPVEFEPETPIGSGPYKVQNFEPENFMHMVPHEGEHPLSGQSELLLQAFQDQTSAIQAFKQGEINLISGLSQGGFENIQNSMSGDQLGLDTTQTIGPIYYLMQCHRSPVKFEAFRDAMGTVMNRQLMNEVAFSGANEVELHSTMFMRGNPFRPPDDMLHKFTDDPTGDVEAARQKLSDAGWSWDDDGNLRYPMDVDTSPQWPQGQAPAAGTFPCITPTDDGEATYTVDI